MNEEVTSEYKPAQFQRVVDSLAAAVSSGSRALWDLHECHFTKLSSSIVFVSSKSLHIQEAHHVALAVTHTDTLRFIRSSTISSMVLYPDH